VTVTDLDGRRRGGRGLSASTSTVTVTAGHRVTQVDSEPCLSQAIADGVDFIFTIAQARKKKLSAPANFRVVLLLA
jgi:hypothetical protein